MKINHKISKSQKENTKEAINECMEEITKDIDKSKNKDKIAIVFATKEYELEKIGEELSKHTLFEKNIGAIVPGIIHQNQIMDKGVQICLMYSETETFYTEIVEEINKDTFYKGKKLAKKLLEKIPEPEDEGNLFLLPDGDTTNMDGFIEGIYFVLGAKYPMTGGGVGQFPERKSKIQLHNSRVLERAAIALLIDKPKTSRALFHGYKPLTRPFIITKSNNNIIEEIDGKEAYLRLKELLDIDNFTTKNKNIIELIKKELPLGTITSKDTFILRVITNITEKNKIICANDVPEQSIFYTMSGKGPKMMKKAIKHAALCQEIYGEEKGNLLLMANCVLRFNPNTTNEIKQIRKKTKNVETFGFLSLGEIGTIKGNKANFHNKSVSLLLL